MAGMEVEELRPVAPPFEGVVVGEIVACEPHPNADKLSICRVDAGGSSKDGPLQIVCGASNARAGLRAPLAIVGALLPATDDGTPFEIKVGQLRGIESRGMLCSARELKLSDDHAGLLELPADAPIGANVRELLQLDDTLFTLKLTPNLGHCLSVYGIAREVSALTGAPLSMPAIAAVATASRCEAASRDRSARIVRALLRPHRAGHRDPGEDAALDRRALDALRPASGQRASRHLQLRDVRIRPAVAHLRSRQDSRQAGRSLGPRRRAAEAAERRDDRARRAGRRHRRWQRRRIAGRHHGRRCDCGIRRHAQHLCRGGVLVARCGGRTLAPLRLLDRCRAPLRTRGRSGPDGATHRAHHQADRRRLRRRGRPDGRPDRQPAAAHPGGDARRTRIEGDRDAGRAAAVRRGVRAARAAVHRARRHDHRDAAELAFRPATSKKT